MKTRRFAIGPIEVVLSVQRRVRDRAPRQVTFDDPPYKLHIGPGGGWIPPDPRWLTVDIDPGRGDIIANFNAGFEAFPLADASTQAIYASHIFEHVSIYRIGRVMRECHRILVPGGVLRIVVPNPAVSMVHYLRGDHSFPLFARRIARAKKAYNEDYTLFEALKGDFISPNGQPHLLGEALAHQNAWDFESMRADLVRAGFSGARVKQSNFQESESADFAFEGTYPSEANEAGRSLYVEAQKEP